MRNSSNGRKRHAARRVHEALDYAARDRSRLRRLSRHDDPNFPRRDRHHGRGVAPLVRVGEPREQRPFLGARLPSGPLPASRRQVTGRGILRGVRALALLVGTSLACLQVGCGASVTLRTDDPAPRRRGRALGTVGSLVLERDEKPLGFRRGAADT